MRKVIILADTCLAVALFLGLRSAVRFFAAPQGTKREWPPNDRSRPLPPVITPGTSSTEEKAGAPPSDAIILFNGHDLSNWESVEGGGPVKWRVGEGYFEVSPRTGDIQTRQGYGDCQLHIEWATPNPPRGRDQDRGNSGVFLHGLYEVQVLDSYTKLTYEDGVAKYDNITYADGEAGALYGQYPPLVNASRKPGEWQTYDIVFHGPRFSAAGKLLRPAIMTVIYNGVLVQDHVSLMGPTAFESRPPYRVTPEKLPLRLQDHNHPVRFRNVWLRELPEGE
jgi:hypothetical protein